MIKKRRYCISGILLAFSLVLSLVPVMAAPQSVSAQTGTEITSLPFTANMADETYYLSTDLVCSDPDAAGITIAADGVTIDGQGHKITGSAIIDSCEWAAETDPCRVSGVYNAGYDGVAIKELEIEGFCTGVALHGTGKNKIERNNIENCRIHDNGFNTLSNNESEMVTHGVHACHISDIRITNNDIYDNEGTGAACGDGGNGIFIYAGSPENKQENSVISGNKLHDNAKAGFWTKMMLSYTEISNNEVWRNGYGSGITDDVRGGIILRCKLSDDNEINGNNIHDNDVDGLFIGGNRNIIEDNKSVDNVRYGINTGRSDGSCDNVVNANTVCGNGVTDIVIDSSVTGNTGKENICDSTDNYDDEGTSGCTYTCEESGSEMPVASTLDIVAVPDEPDDTTTISDEPDDAVVVPDEPDTATGSDEPVAGQGQCGGVSSVELSGLVIAVGGLSMLRRRKQ